MPDEKVAAGKRFAGDMRRVRLDRDVSLASIHEQTQIAETLLESFERGGLYDHSTFNEVYLRSFVRAYAAAIGISPDTAVSGLESALQGDYQNALAVEYLQEEPEEAGEEPTDEGPGHAASDDSGASEPTVEDVRPDDAGSESADPSQSGDESPVPSEEDSTTVDNDDIENTPDPGGAVGPPVGADDAPPHPASGTAGDRQRDAWPQTLVLSIGTAVLVLGLVGIGLWYAFGGNASSTSSPGAPDTVDERSSSPAGPSSEDTMQAGEPSQGAPPGGESEDDAPVASPTLEDTLHLTLRADSTVSGIRIRRDEDLRRPYWIEQGDAAAFPFTSRVIVENGLDDVSLYLENRRVQPTPDSAGRIILDRGRVTQLLNDAGPPPSSWEVPTDTLPVRTPPSDTSAG